ncbi:MAG: 2,3-diaminopropionate biosynthesis protein SbnA [Jatrophihabitantaceae bacterium]
MIVDQAYSVVTDDVFLRMDGLIPRVEVLLKLEGLNPAGSVKLKTAVELILDAEERGTLLPGGQVIESSSGNLGIALSIVCTIKGYPFTCITDPKASAHSIAIMRALGTQVVIVTEPDENGGFLGTRLAHLEALLKADPSLFWPNQYANPAGPRAHWKQTAAAILRELDRVDYLLAGVGTGGTLMGCAAYFRQHSPHTVIVAVDTVGSVTFGGPPAPRYVPGLGTSRVPEIVRTTDLDEVIHIGEADTIRACREVARRYGLLVGGSTGSVVAAALQLSPRFRAGDRVVIMSPDLGDKYLDSVYDDQWVNLHFGPEPLASHDHAGPVAGGTGTLIDALTPAWS